MLQDYQEEEVPQPFQLAQLTNPGRDAAWDKRMRSLESNEAIVIAQRQAEKKRLADFQASPEGQAFLAKEQEARQMQQMFQKYPDLQKQFLLKREEARLRTPPAPPSGYRINPDGTMAFVPGGPADPAVAAALKSKESKPPTDSQLLSAGYADRMIASEKIMAKPAIEAEAKPGIIESSVGVVPLVGKLASNVARSKERQQYRQAQEDWVRAKLRKESGAVIADEEMDREIRVYFPQLGDSPEVVNQKKDSRAVATQAMLNAADKKPHAVAPTVVKQVKRTGTYMGKKVVEYTDGTVEYQ